MTQFENLCSNICKNRIFSRNKTLASLKSRSKDKNLDERFSWVEPTPPHSRVLKVGPPYPMVIKRFGSSIIPPRPTNHFTSPSPTPNHGLGLVPHQTHDPSQPMKTSNLDKYISMFTIGFIVILFINKFYSLNINALKLSVILMG